MTPRHVAERAPVWRGGLILAVLAALCTALVAYTHRLTAERIAENERAFLRQSLQPVLADLDYDSDTDASVLLIPAPNELPGSGPTTVYRVFNDSRPVAALFVVTATKGFSGPIKLLVGIGADGRVSGVRVLQHHETPGLGDLIEVSKSDWIRQFAGTSLDDPARGGWAIRRDGGEFDQLTGASITPRAVIEAIKQTLLYFESHREEVFRIKDERKDDAAP